MEDANNTATKPFASRTAGGLYKVEVSTHPSPSATRKPPSLIASLAVTHVDTHQVMFDGPHSPHGPVFCPLLDGIKRSR